MPFCIKRARASDRCLCLEDVDYIVDKLHIKGHIGKNCKKCCHTDNFPWVKSLNSVVCEQKNFWLGKYEYSLKHMGIYRFNFFVFLICDAYNQLNIDNKLGFIVNHDIKEKSKRQKRKRNEADVVQLRQNMNDTSGFFSEMSETLENSTCKKQKKNN